MMDDPSSVALPSSPLIAACLTNNNIKDVSTTKMTTKIRQEMTKFMLDDDSLSVDNNLVVFATQSATTLPPALMTASSQNKSAIRDGSRIENRIKIVQKLTSPLMNNDSINPEGNTVFSDASSDAIPLPTLLIAASTTTLSLMMGPELKPLQKMDRN